MSTGGGVNDPGRMSGDTGSTPPTVVELAQVACVRVEVLQDVEPPASTIPWCLGVGHGENVRLGVIEDTSQANGIDGCSRSFGSGVLTGVRPITGIRRLVSTTGSAASVEFHFIRTFL